MKNYFTEAIKELEHVVWPTNKETKKYFNSMTFLITILTIFLFIVGTIFSFWLFTSKELINPAKIRVPKDYQKNINLSGSSLSGALDLKNLKIDASTWTTNSWTEVNSDSWIINTVVWSGQINTSTGSN